MAKIIGNTTATPNPRPDWVQTDETKADYIKNKPTSLSQFTNDINFINENEVDTKIAELVNSAPETLNTLNELATALGNDPNFATTVATEIGKKVDKIDGKGLSTNDYTTEEKNKLANLIEGAEANVQSDWNQTDETQVDYIKNKPEILTLDNVVGQKTTESGEIFNDYDNNKALTPYSSASGTNTQAGACGYHFTNLEYQQDEKGTTVAAILSIPKHYESGTTIYDVHYIGFAVGDIVNIDAVSHQYEIFRIKSIDSDTDFYKITIEQVKRIEPFGYDKYNWVVVPLDNKVLKLASDSINDNWVWCSKKSTVGFPIPAFIGNIAAGKNNKALGYSTVSLGRDNVAVGNHGTVFGRRSKAVGYVSLASGFETEALGSQSASFGKQTLAQGDRAFVTGHTSKALGNDSFAGGNSSVASGENSLAFGLGAEAIADNSTALGEGTYIDTQGGLVIGRNNDTKRSEGALFVIGNGSSSDSLDRSNLFAVYEDGTAILNGDTLVKTNDLKPFVFKSDENAKGQYSFAAGYNAITTETAFGAFASGANTKAQGSSSFVTGYKNTAYLNGQAVFGRLSLLPQKDNNGGIVDDGKLFIIGNGTEDGYGEHRSNAFEVYRNGSAKISNSLILTDKTTGTDYRVYINNGSLQIEEIE